LAEEYGKSACRQNNSVAKKCIWRQLITTSKTTSKYDENSLYCTVYSVNGKKRAKRSFHAKYREWENENSKKKKKADTHANPESSRETKL
jgi:hypothetical protein